MRKFFRISIVSIWMFFIGFHFGIPATLQDQTENKEFRTPEKVVTELYRLVTFRAGEMPDWEKVKGLFIEEAVIVLRLGPATLRTFNRQDFVDYFIYDIKRANLLESGFTERILRSQIQTIRDIAHCYVLYEVIVPGRFDDKPVNRGIDSFHLIKKEGKWRIASIVNEGFRMTEPIPDIFGNR